MNRCTHEHDSISVSEVKEGDLIRYTHFWVRVDKIEQGPHGPIMRCRDSLGDRRSIYPYAGSGMARCDESDGKAAPFGRPHVGPLPVRN